MTEEITLKITGFSSLAEAKAFADWYWGQGEQDSCIWFEECVIQKQIQHSSMDCDGIEKIDDNTMHMKLRMGSNC